MNKNYITNKKVYGIPDKDYFFDTWPIIIIALLWFPPIGLILLLRRSALHRRNLFTMGNMAIGIGIFFLLIFGIFLFGVQHLTIYGAAADVMTFLIFFNFFVGLIIIGIGILTKLTARRYRKYIKLIVNRKIENLDIISTEMKTNRKNVIRDLDKMISKRYLERYVINEAENKIYLPEELIARQRQEELIKQEKEALRRVVECKNCGANNLVTEKIGRCEYCNSYIK